MNYLTLPLDISSIENIDFENNIIDMSDLRFPDNKIRSAFIFIRNADLDMNFDFSKCSYETKEEFVLMYIKGNINVKLPIIRDTLIDIIISKYTNENIIIGIFTRDEINKFINDNIDLVNELCTLVISLPILGVYHYSKSDSSISNMINFDNEFEYTNYDEINFNNFSFLTESELFTVLIQIITDYTPKFYSKYFDGVDQIAIARINSNLPIINLLNIFFAPEEIQNNFVSEINNILTVEEEADINE